MIKSVFVLVLCVFCSFTTVFGQANEMPENSIRVGINRVFFGSGDILGTGIYAEYSYSLNDYFAVTPRIMSAYANRQDQWNFDHASSFGSSLAIRITPLPYHFRWLKLDLGGLYHRFINSYGSIDRNRSGLGSSTYYQEDLFGLIGSLNINIVDNRRMEGGLRFDMLTSFTEGYFNSDSSQAGVYLGVKF